MSVTSIIHEVDPALFHKVSWESAITQEFVNASSEDIDDGQMVQMDGDFGVAKLSDGYPIGIAYGPASPGGRVGVLLNTTKAILAAQNGSSTNLLNFGEFVKQTGTKPVRFEPAGNGDYAVGIVLKGAAAEQPIKVALLHTPVKM